MESVDIISSEEKKVLNMILQNLDTKEIKNELKKDEIFCLHNFLKIWILINNHVKLKRVNL